MTLSAWKVILLPIETLYCDHMVTLLWCEFVFLEGDLMEGSAAFKDQPWRGMVVDIWLQLAATLNFTFTLALSSDRKWGARNQVGFIL